MLELQVEYSLRRSQNISLDMQVAPVRSLFWTAGASGTLSAI